MSSSVCCAGQACVQLACLAPDLASAQRQLANAVLHFESVSSSACHWPACNALSVLPMSGVVCPCEASCMPDWHGDTLVRVQKGDRVARLC